MFAWIRSIYRSGARRAIGRQAASPLFLETKELPEPVDLDLRWSSPLKGDSNAGEVHLPYLITDPRRNCLESLDEDALKRHVLWCDTHAVVFPSRDAANDTRESTGSSWTEGGPRP